MKPMIKYRGGKFREIPLFQKYIPENFDTYIEPFFGGGATYFYLEPEKSIINDVNSYLIDFYKNVRDNFDKLSSELKTLETLYEKNQIDYLELKALHPDDRVENKNEALYYSIRDMFNGIKDSSYLPGTIYFFINKTAYSGMIRYNKNGQFNVPFGRYPHLNTDFVSKEHSNILKQATIFNKDFNEIFKLAKENDFMFLDPPYDTIFNDYGNLENPDGFTKEDHERLAESFKKLKCKALMVIGKTDLTESLYKDYIKEEYGKSYAVNIRNRFKSEAKHIIVTNY